MEPISILQLEDSRIDAELSLSLLKAAGILHEARRVETEDEFRAALLEQRPDIILADYALPNFDGISALKVAMTHAPETPFIFVSGKMGEDLAVDCLHGGATDFVLKQRLTRLAPAVRRALAEVEVRAAKRRVEDERAAREREEAARSAAESQAKTLAKLNAQLDQFAYAASHDLQEPLRNIRLCSQLLAKGPWSLDEQAVELLREIERGIHRMDGLVKGLLAYSRLVHHPDRKRQRVDLESVVNHVLCDFKQVLEQTRGTVIVDPLPSVHADRERITSVFRNLISNALKYKADREPHIHIFSGREHSGDGEPQSWTIAVKDNGIGFEPRHSEQIFNLFRRLHDNDYPGTGVGLALVKRIVEEHGGNIWAESRPGEGATFYFTLPDASENSRRATAS